MLVRATFTGMGHVVPVNFPLVFKKPKSNTVHRRIAPALIEETTRAVEMLKVVLVRFTPPEAHVCDLEIAPEVTCTVAICLQVVLRSPLVVCNPAHCIVRMKVLVVRCQEFECLWPELWNRLRRVVQLNGKAVGLVVVLHEAEDIVVDITEEVHLGLDSPIVLHIRKSWMLVKQPRIPATHLVVAEQVSVLYILLFQYVCALGEQILIYPARHSPVVVWKNLISDLRFGELPRSLLELLGERYVVEKCPGVIELVIPCSFQIGHGLYDAFQLLITNKRKNCRVNAIRHWVVRSIVVALDSPERFRWFTSSYACQRMQVRRLQKTYDLSLDLESSHPIYVHPYSARQHFQGCERSGQTAK